jgi:hypothetical protein
MPKTATEEFAVCTSLSRKIGLRFLVSLVSFEIYEDVGDNILGDGMCLVAVISCST